MSADTSGTDSARLDGATADLLAADGALPDAAGLDLARADLLQLDQGLIDAGAGDSALGDAAATDLPQIDSASLDSSALDQTGPDLGAFDAAAPDVSVSDLPAPDVPGPDVSGPDVSGPDVSASDLLLPDMAPPESGPVDSGECPIGHQGPPDCVPMPPVVTVPIPPTTGWDDEQGDSIMLGFISSAVGATFMCRTAAVGVVATRAFSICDGASGTLGVHYPQPDPPGQLDGRYRTEIYVEVSGYDPSPVVAVEYYVHSSLNDAVTCPSLATSALYFSEASRYLDTSDAFDSLTELTSPFITLDVTASSFPRRIWFGPEAEWDPDESYLDYRLTNEAEGDAVADTLSVLSLRRRFELNPAETLLLIERTYISRTNPETVGCSTAVEKWRSCNSLLSGFPATTLVDVNGTEYKLRDTHCRGQAYLSVPCAAIVMNARGNAVCLGVDDVSGAVTLERLNPFFANGSPRGFARHFSDKTRDPGEASANPEWLYLPD